MMSDLLLAPVAPVSFRLLLQIAVLSLGLTLACRWSFRGDPLSRRSLGVAAVWLLTLVPLVLLFWQPRYQIGLHNPPALPELGNAPALVLWAWLVVTLWGSVGLVIGVVRSTRALGRLPTVTLPASVLSMRDVFCQRLGISAPALVCGERCCASSIGRSTLVVPTGFACWPAVAQRSVIAHELVHLQRGDDRFMVALQLLARCYPFCPWLQELYQRFVCALEEACDERAAELMGCRSLYMQGLAEAALLEGAAVSARPARSLMPETAVPVASLINGSHKHSFMQRLARLLARQQFFEVQSGALAAGMAVGLLSLAAFTTFEFVEIPKRYSAAVLSLAGSTPTDLRNMQHREREAAPGVSVVSRLPDELARRAERITPDVIYPGRALNHGIEGDVLVEFGIAADGSTVAPQVVRSTHPDYFNRSAVAAVQQTVYHTTYNAFDYKDLEKTGLSGVNAAQDLARTGELQAVRTHRSNRAQKLFLFRLHPMN